MGSFAHVSMWIVCVIATQLFCGAACYSSYKGPEGPLPYDSKTYTPLSSGVECNRQCSTNGTAKTCYYHFTLEQYVTLGAACVNQSTRAQCVPADGIERSFLAVNRMLPGPSIQVCEGDQVVIDVKNKIPGREVTLHWHGIYQQGTQYYDGVPFVTQCPIPEGTTFRYHWYANPGTHFWHSHAGLQKLDGLHGALIVRQAPSRDPSSSLYDVDSSDHVVELADWMHEWADERFPGRYTNRTGTINQDPDTLLINGLGRYTDPDTGVTTNTSYAEFVVKKGLRYRLRVIASTSTVCQVQVSVEQHSLLVIAADGEAVQPRRVNTAIMSSGERFDFVLEANQTARSYWIQVRGVGECQETKVQQLAILRYQGVTAMPTSQPPMYDTGLPLGVVLNSLMTNCNGSNPNRICISELKNARTVDKGILKEKSDITIFLPFRFFEHTPQELFSNPAYYPFLVNDQFHVVSLIDEVSYVSPSSPLISQPWDILPEEICNYDRRPARCANSSQLCTCTHVVDVPLGAVVEIIVLDYVSIPLLNHPFHLHGYSYYVLGMGVFPSSNVTLEDMMAVLNMNRTELLQRQSFRPPGKDTLTVPNNGYTIVRFRADNPGMWFYHCHFLYHIVIGMNLVVHVGKPNQLPPVPPRFPRCGNYLPPITAP